MEPVGGAASIITLISIAIKSYSLVDGIIQKYRKAPAEFKDLLHQLDGVHTQLILLHHLQTDIAQNNMCFVGIEMEHVKRFLENTTIIFSELYCMLEKQALGAGKCSRVKWAIQDSAKVKRWKTELRNHSGNLANILLLLNA